MVGICNYHCRKNDILLIVEREAYKPLEDE